MTAALAVFVAAGLAIVYAGSIQARAADVLAERSGLGRLWIGSVVLAAGTSLPELAVDVSAVRLGAADLAAGDLFGSSLANMLILGIIGYLRPTAPVFRAATPAHAVTACVAIALNAAAGIFVLTSGGGTEWPVGPESLLLTLGFLVGMRVVYGHRSDGAAAPVSVGGAPAARPGGLAAPARRFGLATLVVLAAAPGFAWAAERIATMSGLGTTFVGTWLVGLTTSLPELVATIAALRIGAVDLAIGNLFGSNAFNVVIFLPLDLAHPGGSLFAVLDPVHALSALMAVILMAVGLAAIVLRSEGRRSVLEPGSGLLVLLYLAGLLLLYTRTAAPGAGP